MVWPERWREVSPVLTADMIECVYRFSLSGIFLFWPQAAPGKWNIQAGPAKAEDQPEGKPGDLAVNPEKPDGVVEDDQLLQGFPGP